MRFKSAQNVAKIKVCNFWRAALSRYEAALCKCPGVNQCCIYIDVYRMDLSYIICTVLCSSFRFIKGDDIGKDAYLSQEGKGYISCMRS